MTANRDGNKGTALRSSSAAARKRPERDSAALVNLKLVTLPSVGDCVMNSKRGIGASARPSSKQRECVCHLHVCGEAFLIKIRGEVTRGSWFSWYR